MLLPVVPASPLAVATASATLYRVKIYHHPKTFLLSIVGVPSRPGERIGGFSISTLSVDFKAVCRIPDGWTIKAGGDGNLDGVLEGEGSASPAIVPAKMSTFSQFVLVSLPGPVRRHDTKLPRGGVIPATFQGTVTLWRDIANREVSLTSANIGLTPARHCPGAPR